MNRLTINKPASEMSMTELAHNSCYAIDRKARYRDFGIDIDARDFARSLMVEYSLWEFGKDDELKDDESFDFTMHDNLSMDPCSNMGLIALFYRNLWAMADLHARLKEYEDAEEQGLLLRLPCKVGSMVYEIKKDLNQMKRETIEHNGHYYHRNIDVYFITQVTFEIEDFAELGRTVFLTKEEAEQAVARMEKDNG